MRKFALASRSISTRTDDSLAVSRHFNRAIIAAQVREGNWKVAPLPEDLLDRRVEITGPTDRKMVRFCFRADQHF